MSSDSYSYLNNSLPATMTNTNTSRDSTMTRLAKGATLLLALTALLGVSYHKVSNPKDAQTPVTEERSLLETAEQLPLVQEKAFAVEDVLKATVHHRHLQDLGIGGTQQDDTPSEPPSVSMAPSVSMMPSDVPSEMPSLLRNTEFDISNAPSEMPSLNRGSALTLAPSVLPSLAPTVSPVPSSAPTSAPLQPHATGYFIVWYTRGYLWQCQDPQPALEATCGGNGTLRILEHDVSKHNCTVDADNGNRSMTCAEQGDEGAILVRCESDGQFPEDLVINVTMPTDTVACQAGCRAVNDKECVTYGADALQRLFVLTACDDFNLYALDETCTDTKKYDNNGNQYCETRTECRAGTPGPCSSVTVDAMTVTTSGPYLRDGGGLCMFPIPQPPTDMPSMAPSISSAPSQAPSDPFRGTDLDLSDVPSSAPSDPFRGGTLDLSDVPSESPSVSMMPSVSAEPSSAPTDEE